ncbi:MAG: transposase [Terriglobia bacterium]
MLPRPESTLPNMNSTDPKGKLWLWVPTFLDRCPEVEWHVILDNYGTHQKCDAWLAAHPNVHFHFTPTSASWLNQVEIWFGILSRKALRSLSSKNTVELRQAIERFIAAYAQNAKPFKWRKRQVKGAQLRNTIVNLRN